jgi:hypothetical protein
MKEKESLKIDVKNETICECCGAKQSITESLEILEGYHGKITIKYCDSCNVSYYSEPLKTTLSD